MRSYSSLLSHVLGSSPEIDGYGETHTLYQHKLDLWRLRRRVRRSTGATLRGRWLLDKILQNYVLPPDRLIAADNVRAIIFLRRPESAIRSIVTMLSARTSRVSQFPIATPESACEYYVSRLHRLRTDGERLGKRAIYFDAEALLERPAQVLAALSTWLELETPLTSDYQVLLRTGEFGFGDPSGNIRSGRILDSSASTIATDVQVAKPVLLEAEAAYQRCRTSLIAHCQVVDAGLCGDDVNWQELIERDSVPSN
jgi:hypothetical protein